MNAPAHPYGGGFMPSQNFVPQQPGYPQAGYCPPSTQQAIDALTPSLFRIANEQRAIYGSVPEAIMVNLFAHVSFAASGNFRIRGHNGTPMPLTLHLRFAGRTLSGKSATHDRFSASLIEAMTGWKKRWRFNNVTSPALLRKIRGGSVLSLLSMAEGRGHLNDQVSGQLSRAFQELNDLYDSNVPAFDRADDDDDEMVAKAPDSAIFVTCVNVQNDKHRAWLDKHAQDAIGSGYLYRLLMMEANEVAVEGAGSQQPEMALLDYDQRIVELIASARLKLESTSANRLPVIDIPPDVERILRSAQERFILMASSVLPPDDAHVFAIRLAANTRRIAGCMHVFERFEGSISVDTMTRATTVAECFAAHWLATVFPPKPMSDAVQRGQCLLDALHNWARHMWFPCWRESDLVVRAPNFGWSKPEMRAAITLICGQGFARVVTRIENGRRVIMLELNQNPVAFQPVNSTYPQKLV